MELATGFRLIRSEIRRIEAAPDITQSYPDAINIASYNILTEFLNRDSPNSWENRKSLVIKAMNLSRAHIIGLQEVNLIQLKDLREAMASQFNFISYVSGIDKNVDEVLPNEIYGELVTIAFDRNRFEMKDSGRIWLSSTPESLSKGWDASRPRILMYVELLDRQTKKEFVVFNTHYDHFGREALIQSGRLEVTLIKKVAGNLPWFAVGDFNSFAYSKSLKAEWSSKEWYSEFIAHEDVNDFRDGTSMGHFGESTTFVGFENDNAKTLLKDGIFETEVMDLGFYNKQKVTALMSYCWPFEYDVDDDKNKVLLPLGMPIKNPEKRQFASDHFLFGGSFLLH